MSYTTKVYAFGATESVLDASAVPEPIRIYTYLHLVNLMTITVYPRITLANYPSWITPYTFNPSSMSANASQNVEVYYDARPSQSSDYSSNGEVEVDLAWVIQFFQDSSRTQLLSQATVTVKTVFINPLHSSWTQVLLMPFYPGCLPYEDDLVYFHITRETEILYRDCDVVASMNFGLTTMRYTSPYHSFRLGDYYRTGGHGLLRINVKQAYSKCFLVFDMFTESDRFTIMRDNTTIKHCFSPFRTSQWLSYALRVWTGWNFVKFGMGSDKNFFIDDVMVICK